MADQDPYVLLTNQVHELMQKVTANLSPDTVQDPETVRRKMSAFTFGLCDVLAEDVPDANRGELYYQFLLKGGLKPGSAKVIVDRTNNTVIKDQVGLQCFEAGKQVAANRDNLEAMDFDLGSVLFS